MIRINHKLAATVLSITMVSVLLTSCLKDEDKEKREDEQRQIEDYIKTHGITPTFSSTSGLYGVVYSSNSLADTAKALTDYVLISYKGRFLDGTLFDTSDTIEARKANILPAQRIGGPLKFSMSSGIYGLALGIRNMNVGDSGIFIMPSLLAYNDYRPKIYEVRLHEIIHNIDTFETNRYKSFVGYLDTTNFKVKDVTQSGYRIQRIPGSSYGDTTKLTDTVDIRYTSRIMEDFNSETNEITGRIFDRSDSARSIVSAFPKPIAEGLRKMKAGESIRVYVPYKTLYGSSTVYSSKTGQIIIPPYSNTMYYIQLKRIVKK